MKQRGMLSREIRGVEITYESVKVNERDTREKSKSKSKK